MLAPTHIVYGRRGHPPIGWYADVPPLGEFTVLHHHLLKGDLYKQSCGDDPEHQEWKRDQARHMAKTGMVIITYDDISGMSWKRLDYRGLYAAHDPRCDGRYLTFRLGDKVANLMKPAQFRRRW